MRRRLGGAGKAQEDEHGKREIEIKMAKVLRALVIDTERDHNTIDTAQRVAKMCR